MNVNVFSKKRSWSGLRENSGIRLKELNESTKNLRLGFEIETSEYKARILIKCCDARLQQNTSGEGRPKRDPEQQIGLRYYTRG
jgi:hypothetical protein